MRCMCGRFHRRHPGRGGKWQISNSGVSQPYWSRNGELIYEAGDKFDQLMVVNYSVKGDSFVA